MFIDQFIDKRLLGKNDNEKGKSEIVVSRSVLRMKLTVELLEILTVA